MKTEVLKTQGFRWVLKIPVDVKGLIVNCTFYKLCCQTGLIFSSPIIAQTNE